MNIYTNPIQDKKLGSYNVISEMTLREYYTLIEGVMNNNEFQRNRVRSSKTIYSLLKQDLISGCLMPPIVLALNFDVPEELMENKEELVSIINHHKDQLFILDGLQRTFTIQDIVHDHSDESESALDNVMRVEIYLNINREGILYRMLTLNTGQTPMSLRHQIEIIYSDLHHYNDNFHLYSETDDNYEKKIGNYRFSDAVDAFTSFLEEDYLQITRDKLLTTIKSYEKLSTFKNEMDVFGELMKLYTVFQNKIDSAIESIDITDDIEFKNPFGSDTYSIFSKSQPMTGFGAAISRLLQLGVYKRVSDIFAEIEKLDSEEIPGGIVTMLELLNQLKITSKKIGNSQRCIFYYFFRNLFDKEDSCYLKVEESITKALQQHDRDK